MSCTDNDDDVHEAVCLGLIVLAFVFGCIIGAWVVSHGPCTSLPTSIPAGLVKAPVDWAFSPTGGYIHIEYWPREYKPKEEK